MKLVKLLALVCAAGLTFSLSVFADGDDGSNGGSGNGGSENGGSNGGQGQPDWGQIQAYLQWLKNNNASPEKPVPTLPEGLAEKIQTARQAKLQFMEQQKQLAQQMKQADKETREQIRQQMREARQTFLQEQKQLMEQIRQQIAEMRRQFKEGQDQLVEAAKEQKNRARGR
ncbi:MAG: hypothetical protein ACP5MD_05135 [Verrucomicrobiia bacterium]